MDLVHAHYVKNLNEGIAALDGSDHLYSKAGEAGYQPYWDSMIFDYGKREVQHFLPASYTHLTRPTILRWWCAGVAWVAGS